MNDEVRQHLEELLEIKQQRYRVLEKQVARLGSRADPSQLVELGELRDEIRSLREQLLGNIQPAKRDSHQGIDSEVHSKLLVGLLVDVSASMIRTIRESNRRTRMSQYTIDTAFQVLVDQAVKISKTPEGRSILSRVSVFCYAYGFGKRRKNFTRLAHRIGIIDDTPELVSEEPIRDLFRDVEDNLSSVPTLYELNRYREQYTESAENHLLDVGMGSSVFCDGLRIALQRFGSEKLINDFERTLLILVSDGNLEGGEDEELFDIIRQIKHIGVNISACYFGVKNITDTKKLYSTPNSDWPQEALRLFECSSYASESEEVHSNILDIAKENHWIVPDNPKLFLQANETRMFKDMIRALIRVRL